MPRMTLPEYIARFCRHQWPQKPQRWSELTDELITAAADGIGCSYSVETAGNLVASRTAGHQPEDLDYFGQPKH